MNEEQDLDIIENGQYKNLNLKPKLHKGIAGLNEGNYVIVEKTFAEGKPIESKYGTSYLCGVKYKEEDVSFFLNEKEHEQYAPLGGIGDKVKISIGKETYVNPKTGAEMTYNKLSFEQA